MISCDENEIFSHYFSVVKMNGYELYVKVFMNFFLGIKLLFLKYCIEIFCSYKF